MTAVFMMPMNVVAYWFKEWVFPPWACKIQAFVYLRLVTMTSCDTYSTTTDSVKSMLP